LGATDCSFGASSSATAAERTGEHIGGSVRLAPGQGLITQRGVKRAVFGMPGWPCAGVDAGFAAAGPGRRAEVTGEPPGRRLGLQVARHPGDKDARGQAHGERQDAVSQAGNDQGLAPLQAIAPGLGRRGRRRSRPAGTAACPPCRPAPAKPVSVAPGARQDTRTPEPRTSSARASVNDSTYAFVAQ
jgi:hypothetical protein